MKALKEHVLSLSKHEHGHTVIIALLDATDDTVLLNKAILSQLLEKAQDLACDEWGRKVSVLYSILLFGLIGLFWPGPSVVGVSGQYFPLSSALHKGNRKGTPGIYK